jgi:hypothetical protein
MPPRLFSRTTSILLIFKDYALENPGVTTLSRKVEF